MSFKKLFTTISIAALATTTLLAQQPPTTNSSTPDIPTQPPEVSEIHIDHDCRVLTTGHPSAAHPNPPSRYRYNSIVCHIESNLQSSHWEQSTVNGAPKSTYVYIDEREYVLQNTMDKPVAFVVDQPVPKGWQIDSDPQPIEINGATATFRVFAQSGQIVRLHVGERH